MSVIKFRGKRIDTGEWVYGWLVIQPDGTAYISKYFKRGEWVEVDPETVGQYVGQPNNNGKEIFEDDVVDWRGIKYKVCIGEFGLRNFETEEVVDLVFGVYGSAINETIEPFCYDMPLNTVWIKHHGIEVIGNIYEHPHLVGGDSNGVG